MRRQLELFVVLFILVFSVFGFTNRIVFRTVGATYVEGPLVQDTVWTRVNSPFVLSNNVTVFPDVTLTLESGVEVRFGGNFSLIVNGRLVANGTENKVIRLTSNNITAEKGDWGTILFSSPHESWLANCIVEYGRNGITVEDGNVTLENSVIGSNAENGITIRNGVLAVRNSEIASNNMSGIYIAGGSQIIVQDNTIRSNGDGISLVGHLTGEISIERNGILFNDESGIVMGSDAYDNMVIINNNVSLNGNGFFVSTSTSTYIAHNLISNNTIGINYTDGNNHQATRNYILNNTVGIYYQSGNNHEAHFNDIYSSNPNDLGMNISLGASANATYNYWGHRSGPFHDTLNPYGKGSPVGGDGVNLDFIFFLSAPIDHENTPPVPVLWADKTLVAPNQTVTFIAADSYDDGRIDQYVFDFNDTSSVWTTLSLFDHNYSAVRVYNASLMVVDDFNVTSDSAATMTINVEDLTPLNVSVTLSSETIPYTGQISVVAYVSNETGAVENANVTLFSVVGGSFDTTTGITNSSGYFTAAFTAPNVTDVTDVMLVARAYLSGYAQGSDHKYLRVIPPLTVQVTPESSVMKSEDTVNVNVDVSLGLGRPVKDALVIVSADSGVFSPAWNTTNGNGRVTFTFAAPRTLVEIVITIEAAATKTGFADGHGQAEIRVEPRILEIGATAIPSTVITGETSAITAVVTSDGSPVPNVTLTITSSLGTVLPATAETDENGLASFVYAAPYSGVQEGTVATISMTAGRVGYVGAEKQLAVNVVPKILIVEVTASPTEVISEAKVNVSVHVSYSQDMGPVSGANVTIMSEEGGSFNWTNSLTDSDGNATFFFTAPPVNVSHDVPLSIVASKSGYVNGENEAFITVNPGVLDVQVNASSTIVKSSETSIVTIYVSCNATPVANASIMMTTGYGNFSAPKGFTDSLGQCTFIFNAPQTDLQLTTVLRANATRNGYVSATNSTSVIVTPVAPAGTGGGLPLITILLIVIPIVAVVIVVVLIRMKIISVSFKEET